MDLARRPLRGFLLALLAGALAGLVAFFVSISLDRVFEARAALLVLEAEPVQERFGTSRFAAPALAVDTYAAAAERRAVLEAALARAELLEPPMDVAELRDSLRIRVEDADVSAILEVAVRNESPARARELADAVAGALVDWDVQRAEDALERTIEGLERQVESLREQQVTGGGEAVQAAIVDVATQLSAARALLGTGATNLVFFEPAEAPAEPVSPLPLRNALIAAALAFILALAVVLSMAPSAAPEDLSAYDRTWFDDVRS